MNKVEILTCLPVELIFVPSSTNVSEALGWEAIGDSDSGHWMLVEWLVLIGLMRLINFVLCIILYGLMMLVVVAATPTLAFIRSSDLIIADAEIRYILDFKMRDGALQDLWRRGSTCSWLNLLEIQFPSSGETDRRWTAVLFLIKFLEISWRHLVVHFQMLFHPLGCVDHQELPVVLVKTAAVIFLCKDASLLQS